MIPDDRAKQFADNLKKVAARSGIPLSTLVAIANQESQFNPSATGSAGEIGLMQILPGTIPDIGGTPEDLSDPWKNFVMGTKYLTVLRDKYGAKDTLDMLGGYNAGPGNIKGKKYAGIKSTDAYIKAITKQINSYKKDKRAYAADLVKLYYALEGGNGKAAAKEPEIPEERPLQFAELPGEIPRTIPQERPETQFAPPETAPQIPATPPPESTAEVSRPSAASLWARGLEAEEKGLEALRKEGIEEVKRIDPVAAFKVIGNTLLNPAFMGKQQAAAVLRAFQGWKGASVIDKGWADKIIASADKDVEEFAQQAAKNWKGKRFLPGISIEDLARLPSNLAYSTTSMMALAPAAAAAEVPVAGPYLAYAVGMGVGGALAYNQASYQIMQEYLEAMNDKSIAERGKPMSKQEENRLKRDFSSEAKKYGLWEAGPEALAGGASVFAALAKFTTVPIAARIAGKVAAMYGGEIATETLTQMGQAGVEARAGLRPEALDWTSATDWIQALREVAPQTALLTTVMGGAGATAVELSRAVNQAKADIPQDHPYKENLQAKLNRDPASIGLELRMEATQRGAMEAAEAKGAAVAERFAPEVTPAGRPAEEMPIAAERPEEIPREEAAPPAEAPSGMEAEAEEKWGPVAIQTSEPFTGKVWRVQFKQPVEESARRSIHYSALREEAQAYGADKGYAVDEIEVVSQRVSLDNPLVVNGLQKDLLRIWAAEGDQRAELLASEIELIRERGQAAQARDWFVRADNYIAQKASAMGHDGVYYDIPPYGEIAVFKQQEAEAPEAIAPEERVVEAVEQPPLLPKARAPEVKATAQDLADRANEEIELARGLYREVMKRGGLRPQPTVKSGMKDYVPGLEEFRENVPPHWRRKKGMTADEMAAELKSQTGYQFDTEDELLQAIAATERTRKQATADLPKGKTKYTAADFSEQAREEVQGRLEEEVAGMVDEMDERVKDAVAAMEADSDVVLSFIGNALDRTESVEAMTEKYGTDAVLQMFRDEIENRALLEAPPVEQAVAPEPEAAPAPPTAEPAATTAPPPAQAMSPKERQMVASFAEFIRGGVAPRRTLTENEQAWLDNPSPATVPGWFREQADRLWEGVEMTGPVSFEFGFYAPPEVTSDVMQEAGVAAPSPDITEPEAPAPTPPPGEMFALPPGELSLELQDLATSEDALDIFLQRKGWDLARVRELQESISRKATPDMFTGETEPLTAGEVEYQRDVQEYIDQQARPEAAPEEATPAEEPAAAEPPAKDTAALAALGYTDSQIRRMMPWAAQTIIEQNISPEKVSILQDGEISYMDVPPGDYTEEQGKTEEEFLDDSPPVGLGVKEVVPLGVTVDMPPVDLVGPAKRIWAGGLRTIMGHFKAWMAPVRIIAEIDPVANKIAHMGRDTVAKRSAELAHDVALLQHGFKGLSKKEASSVQEYLQDPNGGQKVPDKLRPAYEAVNALRWKYYRMAEEEFGIDVSKWNMSPEVYWPHIFVGSYEIGYLVEGEKGQARLKHIEGGFAKNLREAVDRVEDHWKVNHPELLDLDPQTQMDQIVDYFRTHPDANITIRPRQFSGDYSATMLSNKGFWRFIGEVKKATELEGDEVLSMMKGVAAIKPRGKFVGNLMERMSNLGGYMEEPRAFEIYMSRMLTKKYYDPFRKQATELANTLPPALRQYFLEYIDDITGKYDPFNHRFTWTGLQAKITRAESHLKLGFRPITALVNRFQPMQLAYPEIGHYLFRGYIWKRTEAGKAVIEQSGIYGQVAKYTAGEPGYMVKPTEPIYMPLGLFSKAEMANREDVVAGGYLFAKKVFRMTGKVPGSRVTAPAMVRGQIKMVPGVVEGTTGSLLRVRLDSGDIVQAHPDRVVAEKQPIVSPDRMGYGHILQYLEQYGDPHLAALEYAKDLNTDVNFDYSAADLPKLFRIKGGRAILQFRSFPVNAISTALKWTLQDPRNPHYAARMTRMIGSNVILGGVRMVPYIGRKLWWKAMVFAPLAFLLAGDENRDRLKKVVGRGVFSLLGLDLSQRLGVGEFIPKETWQLLGPAAGDFANLVRFVQGDLNWAQLLRINPMIRDIMRAIPQTEHLTDNERARKMVEISGWDRILEAIGAPEVREEVNRDMVALSVQLARNYRRDKAKYLDRIIGTAVRKDYGSIEDPGKRAEQFYSDIGEIYKQAFENGIFITSRDIETELIQKNIPQLFRVYRTFPKPKRPELLKMMDEANRLYGLFPEAKTKKQGPAYTPPQRELQTPRERLYLERLQER